MYDPLSIIDRPEGLGFPHRARRVRPGGSSLSSPGCQICRCMEGFLIRGWEPVVPGWCWSAGLGFRHRARGFDPGEYRVRPRVAGVVDVWRDF